jgi:hypothetical protein
MGKRLRSLKTEKNHVVGPDGSLDDIIEIVEIFDFFSI